MDVQKVSLINLKKIVLSLTGGALIGIGAGTILYAGIGGDTVTVFSLLKIDAQSGSACIPCP